MQRFTSFAAELKSSAVHGRLLAEGGCRASAGQTGQEQVVNVGSGAVGLSAVGIN